MCQTQTLLESINCSRANKMPRPIYSSVDAHVAEILINANHHYYKINSI